MKQVERDNSLDVVVHVVLPHHINEPTQVAVTVEGVPGDIEVFQIIPVEQVLTESRYTRVVKHEVFQLGISRVDFLDVKTEDDGITLTIAQISSKGLL